MKQCGKLPDTGGKKETDSMIVQEKADDMSVMVIAKARQIAKEENTDVENDAEAEASVITAKVSDALHPKLWGHIIKKIV